MKKLGWIIFGLIVLAFASVIGEMVGETVSDSIFGNAQQPELTDKMVAQIASEINSLLPMKVDSGTRLNNVSGTRKRFTYYYTLLNYASSDIDSEIFVKEMRDNLKNSVCSNPNIETFLENGVSIRYMYSGNNSSYIADITVEPSECGY